MKRFAIITLIIIGINLFSYSILEEFSGNYVGNMDARITAMGGAGTAGGNRVFDTFLNPANLAEMNSKFGAQLSFNLLKNTEDRNLPMYDFFSGYVQDAVYVSNVDYYTDMAILAYYAQDFSDFKVNFGLHYKPFVNFDADYQEQVRNDENSDDDNYPPIIARNFIESEGEISDMGFSAAVKYQDIASIGFQVMFLNGDANWNKDIIWTDAARELSSDPLNDYHSKLKRDFSANTIKLGARGNITPRFDLGMSYLPKIEFDIDKLNYTIDGSPAPDNDFQEFITPGRLRAGVAYEPRNVMRTHFNVDIELVQWADVNSLYDNELNYYIGVEHLYKHTIPFRFGFSYETVYQNIEDDGVNYVNKITTPAFSAGTGFRVMSNFTVDIGAKLARRDYDSLDLFMDSYYDHNGLWQDIQPEDRGWNMPDSVEETFLEVKTSVSYNW
ncbi:MAG: hypothetical protein SVM86_08035 [Candidatus Cloacimonadota bacterium]|nr:hypothetical protein [Candidatus Cloacimonadota bacterium]